MQFLNKIKKNKNVRKKGFTLLNERDLTGFTPLNEKEKYLTGFTLIETFIAITILIISIVGPMTLVMKSLSAAKATKGQIVAMYLAQDGIEYIRNIRDENILTGNNWLNDLGDCVGNDTYCMVNTPDHRDVRPCNGNCDPLQFDKSAKLYGYENGDETVFTRSINIDEISLNEEVLVTVKMEWKEGSKPPRDFTIQEHLLNWQ